MRVCLLDHNLQDPLSFIPVIQKQVFDPIEKNLTIPNETSVIHPSIHKPEAQGGLFLGESKDRWAFSERSVFEVEKFRGQLRRKKSILHSFWNLCCQRVKALRQRLRRNRSHALLCFPYQLGRLERALYQTHF